MLTTSSMNENILQVEESNKNNSILSIILFAKVSYLLGLVSCVSLHFLIHSLQHLNSLQNENKIISNW